MMPMQVEYHKTGKMVSTGSSLLRAIQNGDMPILDLLVREATQNCLDAKDDRKDHECVLVDFSINTFDSKSLNNLLSSASQTLNARYLESKQHHFIAIKDSNTVGLTGPFPNSKKGKGNLIKLVYDINKPQDQEGAGGSWGLGKTIYYRIGIGLVVFYSRIFNEETRRYESRLAVTLVEDENCPSRILPDSECGITWWGSDDQDGGTIPITDENQVNDFLKIFRIDPYQGDSVGTTVIIPYIDKDKLLNHNKSNFFKSDDSECLFEPYWYKSIEDYLKIAIQRWYAPRLNNSLYKHGKFLQVSINGEPLLKKDMEPVFTILQLLYNKASGIDTAIYEYRQEIEVKCETVNVRERFVHQDAGCIAAAKLNKGQLKMVAPNNHFPPYLYFGRISDGNVDDKDPFIVYTRKPGMIVSYQDKDWFRKGQLQNSDEFVIGIFVLNSDNNLKNKFGIKGQKLEEFIRRSEKADHNMWENNDIVRKIRDGVANRIIKYFYKEEIAVEKKVSNFSQAFTRLLPPMEFGSSPLHVKKDLGKSKRKIIADRHKSASLSFNPNIRYEIDGDLVYMIVQLKIDMLQPLTAVGVKLGVQSDAGVIAISEWEKMGLKSPFEVSSVRVKPDDKPIDAELSAKKQIVSWGGRKYETDLNSYVRVEMPQREKMSYEIEVKLLKLDDSRPSFVLEGVE